MCRGADHRLLEEDGGVAEGRLGLAHARLEGLAEVLAALDAAHASAAATGHGLGEHGKPISSAAATSVSTSVLGSALRSVGSPPSSPPRWPGPCCLSGAGHWRGPDEGDAVRGALLGEVRVLRQEAVAGVDRVGSGVDGGAHDADRIEVGADRVPRLADLAPRRP